MMNLLKVCACSILLLTSMILNAGAKDKLEDGKNIPSAQREFRGVWVATVANIDWPSKPGLPVDEQKKEAIAIIEKVKSLNFNAIVFQVRPQADALYKSDIEPWSYYLTGQQGKAPEPMYDPLEFWVEESHKRGIELHAWFNPYRANHPANKGEVAETSVVKTMPNGVRKLASKGYYWMDPSVQEVQDHSAKVIMDVVKRYDIDGVHFDDYFYPYADYNEGKDFPDEESWKNYKGSMSREDWRRDAVNKFIKRVGEEIKDAKPHVKYGISPFGIWRPGYPASIQGLDQYDKLYADAKLWWNEGWLDYMTPQLYWPISKVPQSFPVLLNWWKEENTKKRNLFPGLIISGAKPESITETVNQIMVTRGIVGEAPGVTLFSMKVLMKEENELGKTLAEGVFSKQALVPAYPWIDDDAPDAPFVSIEGDKKISIISKGKERPFVYVLYTQKDGKWSYEILPAEKTEIEKDIKAEKITAIAVTAVDRNGNESEKTVKITQ